MIKFCKKLFNVEREIEVWVEGFLTTGMDGIPNPAKRHSIVTAKTLRDAADICFKNDSLYNRERLTHWGCRIFDNANDATRAFG